MPEVTFVVFRAELFNWAAINCPSFMTHWPADGGWENWVRDEVYSYILNINGANDIMKEQHVFTKEGERCDWLLNNNTPNATKVVIELKCQRGSDKTGADFVAGLVSDAGKVGSTKLSVAATGVVVGIYYSREALDRLRQKFRLTMQNHKQFCGDVGVVVLVRGVDFEDS